MKVYCKLCGNAVIETPENTCTSCRKVVEGPLAKAYALFNEACDRYGKCCGRLTSDKSHLYFHGKGWEDNYEAVSSDGERIDDRGVSVDYGIVFYPDYARAYYMTEMTSVEYGLRLDNRSYEQGTFWSHIEFMLGQAAKRAYDDGFRTCNDCSRTGIDDGVCPCADDPDEEDSPSHVTSGDQRRTLAGGEYEVIVKFTRSHEDDNEIAAANYPNDTLEVALRKQFVAELQEGYDRAGIAGFFEVQSIAIGNGEEDSPSHVTSEQG